MPAISRRAAALLIADLSLALAAVSNPPPQSHPGNVQVEMHDVAYHYTDRIAVRILNLEGELLPAKAAGIPVFDDSRSFLLRIRAAEIAISTNALADVLNQHVFAADDAPLKQISITAAHQALKVKGKLHSKGDISFETEGTVSATPQGEIRLHAQKIKAAHLPVKGLMDLLGIKIADLVNTGKVRGVRVEKDDLLLNPELILPPPQIRGRIAGVQVRGNEIVQTFGGQPRPNPALQQFGNYMAYRGAQLKFGKLLMTDTDMVLIDMDPRDPFDFSLARYREQLVAGYTKTTPQFGLRVFMRDLNKLTRPATGNSKKSPPTKE